MPEPRGAQLHRFPNGLRLIVDARPGTDACAVAVTVGGGSRLDPAGRSGLAHLVEHLMFRQSRVVGGHTATVQGVGGVCNATTHRDHTAYHSLVPDELLEDVLALEAQRFTAPTATAAGVAAERAIVAREIHELLGQSRGGFPWIAVPRSLFRAPATARPPHGDLAELRSITAADCARHLRHQYVASNIVVSVVGGCPVDRVVDLVGRLFSGLPAGPTPAVRPQGPAAGDETGTQRVEARHAHAAPDGMCLTAVGFPAPDVEQDRAAYLELVVLVQILSAHHLPTLRSQVSGLVHAAMTVGDQGRWMHCLAPDLAVCQLVTRAGEPAEGDDVGQVDRALRYVRNHDVTEEQRQWAIRRLQLAHYQETDDLLRCALALGQHEVLGLGWESFTGLGEELRAMTTRPLRNAAARLLDGGRAVVRLRDRKESNSVS